MKKEKLVLSKFDVAERQLLQAIRLFFEDSDPVSIHTLAEAASQVFHDIRVKYAAVSFSRDSGLIRQERLKEWNRALVSSRNFFKHADKDQDAKHEFNVESNHFSLLDAAYLYEQIKGRKSPESFMFGIWFYLQYPDVLLDGPYKDAMANLSENYGGEERLFFMEAIERFRESSISLPDVTNKMGLIRDK